MGAVPKLKKQQNVIKSRPNPSRSLDKPGDDHPMGLWVNTEFLRKLTTREPRFSMLGAGSELQNRYLQLADIALGPKRRKGK